MKILQNKRVLATLALLVAGFLGGLTPVATKIVLRELSPLEVLFWRLSIMLVFYLVLGLRYIQLVWARRLPVVIIASVWAGNMILFNLGIDYTTAIASQLLYLTVPVLVLIEALLFLKESFNTSQLIGLGLGLIGGLIVVLAPSGNASFGAFKGNTLIFLGTLCWSLYIMLSRRLSVNLPSIGVLVPAVFFSWIGSVVMLLSREDMSVFGRIMDVSPLGMSALLYVGILSGVVMFILFQWGVKHGPAIVAGSTVYVSMVSGGIGAMIVLGERLTAPFVFGGVLLLGGVFLTSTLPLLEKYRSRK